MLNSALLLSTASRHLLAIPSQRRLKSVLKYLFDETEFLAPYGEYSSLHLCCPHFVVWCDRSVPT